MLVVAGIKTKKDILCASYFSSLFTTQSSMIPVVKVKKLKGIMKINHRLALDFAITKTSDIHTKTTKF